MTFWIFSSLFTRQTLPNLCALTVHGHADHWIVSVVEFLTSIYNNVTVQLRLHVAGTAQGNQHGHVRFFLRTCPGKTNVALVARNHGTNGVVAQIRIDFGSVLGGCVANDRTFTNSTGLGIHVQGHHLQQGTEIFVGRIVSSSFCLCSRVGRRRTGSFAFGIRNGRNVQCTWLGCFLHCWS